VQCGTADCINHNGCFTDMVGGVRAVPTAALRYTTRRECSGSGVFKICFNVPIVVSTGFTPLTCAAEAKKNGGTVFAIQSGSLCFYGTDLSAAIAQGPSAACTAACADTTQSNCGGSNANSLYNIV
jgi:hypothetical protein